MATVAIPNPMTWDDAVVYPASTYNTEIRDAVSFLVRPPMFFGQHTTAISLPTATWVALPLQTEVVNSEGTSMHSTSTNPTRVTATHAGTWEFIGGASFAHSSLGNVGRHISGLRKNGTTFIRGRSDGEGIDGTTSIVRNAHVFVIDMAVGDYVELMAWQETGATQNTWIIGSDSFPYLVAKWRSI